VFKHHNLLPSLNQHNDYNGKWKQLKIWDHKQELIPNHMGIKKQELT